MVQVGNKRASVRMRDGPRDVVRATILSPPASRNITNKAAGKTIERRLWSRDGYPWVSCEFYLEPCCTNSRSIYKEIGPGKRVALSKLAVEKFEETGRPLRIAIDTSIWLFQIQASKGQFTRLCAPLAMLTVNRRYKPRFAHLLLSPPSSHLPRDPSSLRL
jgi:hypothetical protein